MAGGHEWITELKLKNKPINEQVMKKFYFTFGFGQQYENCYVVIESETWNGAREEMVRRYGTKWSFQYTEEDWVLSPNDPNFRTKCFLYGVNPKIDKPITQAEMYGLREIR